MNWDYNQLDLIDTARCRLRPIQLSDAPALLRLYGNSNVIRYTEHKHPMQSIEEAEYSIHFYRKGYIDQWMYRWGVTLIDHDWVIGTAGLHRVNREHHFSMIGYEIHDSYWNRGLATEVVSALTDYGFRTFDLNRIEAELIAKNVPSARVLQKNRFQYEATRRQHLRKQREFFDIDVYAILRSEWMRYHEFSSA